MFENFGLTCGFLCSVYTDWTAAVLLPRLLGHLFLDGNLHIPNCS